KWKFNQKSQCIVGLNSGCAIHLGKAMKVRIVSVNVPARQLNVSPTEALVSTPVKGRNRKTGKKFKKVHTRKRPKGKVRRGKR
ncbi:MAG: hypothetical protein ACYSSO_11595, partial [Planctomycetota bacterium]